MPTLREWRARFLAHCAGGRVHALGFDEPFIRTWLLYLAFSEAAFAERTLGDHQLLLVREPAVTVTVVVIPPRIQNLPVTVIDVGAIAATTSSQI